MWTKMGAVTSCGCKIVRVQSKRYLTRGQCKYEQIFMNNRNYLYIPWLLPLKNCRTRTLQRISALSFKLFFKIWPLPTFPTTWMISDAANDSLKYWITEKCFSTLPEATHCLGPGALAVSVTTYPFLKPTTTIWLHQMWNCIFASTFPNYLPAHRTSDPSFPCWLPHNR